jgi:hypothetical protein
MSDSLSNRNIHSRIKISQLNPNQVTIENY